MKRMSALLLAAALTIGSIPMNVRADEIELPEQIVEEQQGITLYTQSKTAGFSSKYTLTGVGGDDMAAIALAQEGRTGSDIGYTEEWCANFISDCAILAGQSKAIPQHGLASTLCQNILSAGGVVVTSNPKPGDICFINWNGGSSIGHAEIVYAVSGSEIYTIGGNSGSADSLYSRSVKKHAPLASKYIVKIVRPAYELRKHTVKFDANGGSCSTGSVSVTTGTTVGSLPIPTREGYEFVGWFTQKDTTGVAPVSSSMVIDDATTLYAHWAKPVYSGNQITFNLNGGSLSGALAKMTVSGSNNARGASAVMLYNCVGMTVGTNQYGTEIAVNSYGQITAKRASGSSTELTVPSNGFVLSAHNDASSWLADAKVGQYVGLATVSGTTYAYLYQNRNECLANHKYVASGGVYNGLPVPEKAGYVLDGWFTAASGGTEVKWNTVSSASTLYARWVAVENAEPSAVLEDQANGRRYERYDYLMSWEDAEAFCESLGGHLVTITSREEQELIVNSGLLSNPRRGQYAIGATDRDSEGNWTWVTGEAFSYNNWDTQVPEPNGGTNENYGEILAVDYGTNYTVGEWLDINNLNLNTFHSACNSGFICEFENVCYHNYQTSVMKPTCTAQGYTVYTCSDCGASHQADYTAASGHNMANGICGACGAEVPQNPSILSCYSTQQTSVKVTWTTVDGVDGYEIWRSTDPAGETGWCRIKTINGSTTDCYTNQNLEPGVTYYYKVRAFTLNGNNEKQYSDFSEVHYMPAAVVFDNPYSNDTGKIRLRWKEVSGAQNYQIWRLDSDGNWCIVKNVGSDVTAYSNSGLTAGKTYTYKMRAVTTTEDGRRIYGAYSDEYSVAVKPENAVVTVTSSKSGRALISWDAVQGAAGYQIWMADSPNGNFEIAKTLSDGSTSYTKYGLTSGKTYYFKVRVYAETQDSKSFSDNSAVISCVVK